MTFEEYQAAAAEFAIYPKDREREYLSLGLISEVGELAGKVKKEIRDGVDLTEAILAEIGDCCWYAGQIMCRYHFVYRFGGSAETKKFTDTGLIFEMAETCASTSMYRLTCILDCLDELSVRRGSTLEAVCEANIAKLRDRKERDAIKGSGDNR